MGGTHLVVDGSNIATEGRSLPSLQQLLDAVAAVGNEAGYENITVVVDASFGHRIDESERAEFETRLEAGELITPPAGVIGRGDAFILEVADRVDAVVLSNDSFQEFHGTYTWLFDEGRLLGGKHVPGVGWIFLARSPVRGPTSRRAVSDAKRKRRSTSKAATGPATKAAKKKTTTAKSASKKKSAARKKKEPIDDARKRGGKEPEPYNEPLPFIEFVGAHPVGSVIEAEIEQFSSHGAYVICDGTRCYISLKAISDPPPRSARDVFAVGETRSFVVEAIDTPRRGIDLTLPEGTVVTPRAPEPDDAEPKTGSNAEPPSPGRSTGRERSRSTGRGRARTAATAETVVVAESAATPAPAPAPTPTVDDTRKLSVSQRRKLRAQQEAAAAASSTDAQVGGEAAPAKKAAAKKKAPAKKAAAKKAPAKKSPAKKAAAKKSAAKKAPAKKAPAKKTATKKAAAKKAPAKKVPAKKAAAKKSAAKKAAAKKSAPAKKSPAKKTAAKKTAKKTAAKKSARPGSDAQG